MPSQEYPAHHPIRRTSEDWKIAIHSRHAYVAIMMAWAVMTLWNFGLPGLQLDEINHYAFIPGIKSEDSARLAHFRLPDNYLDEQDGIRQYPILGGSVYNSPTGAYLGLPYFAIAGHSQASVRIFSALIALTSILALARIIGITFGWPAALVAGMIMTSDPSHVFATRSQGASIWPVLMFWALAANLFLHLVREKNAPIWTSALCGVLLGWSVLAYFIGIFLALPTAIATLFILRKRPKHAVIFILSGLLAYSPILYGLVSIHIENPQLLKSFGVPEWADRSEVSLFGSDNLNRFRTILFGAFGSHEFARGVAGGFSTSLSQLRLFLLFILTALLAYTVIHRRRESNAQDAFRWLVSAIVFTYLIGIFALKATSVHHLLPLTVLFSAACASMIASERMLAVAASALCGALLLTNVLGLQKAHTKLVETGGRGYHNESFSIVSPMLAGPLSDYHPVFAGWGFHLQFLFLTDGRIDYTFTGRLKPEYLDQLLNNHEKVAVVTSLSDRKSIKKEFEVENEFIFTQRNGADLFALLLISRSDNDQP